MSNNAKGLALTSLGVLIMSLESLFIKFTSISSFLLSFYMGIFLFISMASTLLFQEKNFVRNAIISSNTHLEEYLVIKEKDELNIYLKPIIVKDEIDKVLLNLYKIHNLKPLKHNYFEYTAQKLDKKRRRVQEI